MSSAKTKKPYFWMRLIDRNIRPLFDAVILIGAFVASYLLRFEFSLSPKELTLLAIQLPAVLLIQFAILYFTGAYSFFWRFIGLAEIKIFIRAGGLSLFILLLLRLFLPNSLQEWRIPLSIIFLDTVLASWGVITLRLFRRYLYV